MAGRFARIGSCDLPGAFGTGSSFRDSLLERPVHRNRTSERIFVANRAAGFRGGGEVGGLAGEDATGDGPETTEARGFVCPVGHQRTGRPGSANRQRDQGPAWLGFDSWL